MRQTTNIKHISLVITTESAERPPCGGNLVKPLKFSNAEWDLGPKGVSVKVTVPGRCVCEYVCREGLESRSSSSQFFRHRFAWRGLVCLLGDGALCLVLGGREVSRAGSFCLVCG